jgi:hypothetical protein
MLLLMFAAIACPMHSDSTPLVIRSEVEDARPAAVRPLLAEVCPGRVTTGQDGKTTWLGCGYARDASWYLHRVEGVVFGHFLSPTSEDAVLAANAGETAPASGGGSLLVTRRRGRWTAVWYKSGVITRHCRKVLLPTGRDILLCEEREHGMGHEYHLLYTLDPLKPTRVWDAPLMMADSYVRCHSEGHAQRQRIEKVEVITSGTSRSATRLKVWAAHGRSSTNEAHCGIWPPARAVSHRAMQTKELEFLLNGQEFKFLAPALARTLFRIGAR